MSKMHLAINVYLSHTNKLMQILFCSFVIILCSFYSNASTAFSFENTHNIQFAGYSFLSNFSDIENAYPYSQKIWHLKDSNGSNLIDVKLREKLSVISNPDINFSTGLGDCSSSELLSLALVVDWEDVTVDEVASNIFRIVINLHAQILVFDFKEMHVVASFPFGIRVNDVSKEKPDVEHIYNLFYKMYFEDIAGVNFLNEFVQRLESIKLRKSYNHRIKVTEVILEPKATRYMPEQNSQQINAYKNFVAQQFSSFLSANKNISILPYSEGQAIKGKMSLRFNTTEILNLTTPEEDIPIKITVRGFKKIILDKDHTGTSWAYGSYIYLAVLDPLDDFVVNAKFKNAAVRIVPSSQAEITRKSDWASYQESILALFDEITKQTATPTSKWINKHAAGENIKKQFESFSKLIKNTL